MNSIPEFVSYFRVFQALSHVLHLLAFLILPATNQINELQALGSPLCRFYEDPGQRLRDVSLHPTAARMGSPAVVFPGGCGQLYGNIQFPPSSQAAATC